VSSPETFFRYETDGDGMWHQWACIAFDRTFAVHIWARKVPSRIDGHEWFGGVEQHAAAKLAKRRVDHDVCSFLDGPCCQDGSSDAFNWHRDKIERAIKSGDIASVFPSVAQVFRERLEAMTNDD
jgi:hypothetical protein